MKCFMQNHYLPLNNGNCDCVPLFKSTNPQFWPILCKANSTVFFVVLFYGLSKPTPVEDYLSDFLDELNKLLCTGLYYKGHGVNISLKNFICDAPARSFLKSTVGNNVIMVVRDAVRRGVGKNELFLMVACVI